MDWWQALILGVVQGLTEFLPISSSAHLIFFPEVLGWPHMGRSFDVALHVGTLLALLIYFRAELARYVPAAISSLSQWHIGKDRDRRMVWMILASCLPAFAVGAFFDDFIEARMDTVPVMASLLIIFALVMLIADRGRALERNLESIGWIDVLVIGFCQALALFPGVSRSGITMTAGMFRKLTREAAARFSFLMSIPAIAGAAAYEGLGLLRHPIQEPGAALYFGVGVLTSFISGFLCIAFLLRFLRTHTFWGFVVYRVALGGLLLSLFWPKG